MAIKKAKKSKTPSTPKKPAKKAAKKSLARPTSAKKSRSAVKSASVKSEKLTSLNSRIKRVVQIDALDQILLTMAAKPYDKILRQIEASKKRLNEERRLALKLGMRILTKAKKVRDSLISLNKSSQS